MVDEARRETRKKAKHDEQGNRPSRRVSARLRLGSVLDRMMTIHEGDLILVEVAETLGTAGFRLAAEVVTAGPAAEADPLKDSRAVEQKNECHAEGKIGQ